MKVALATWNGRISPVFDVARQIQLVEIEDHRILAQREEALPGLQPQAQADRLKALGTEVLICGAVSQAMAAVLEAAHLQVVPFTAGTVEDVLAAWLAGDLSAPELCMPGCRGRRRRYGGNRRRWQETQRHTNKECKMKIAVTATGRELSSLVDPRFGRAKFFAVVNLERDDLVVHDNAQNLQAAQGAGIQAAETVVQLGAGSVLTGNVGPKAFRALRAAGIRIYRVGEMSVAEAVAKFKAGELTESTEANVEGHW